MINVRNELFKVINYINDIKRFDTDNEEAEECLSIIKLAIDKLGYQGFKVKETTEEEDWRYVKECIGLNHSKVFEVINEDDVIWAIFPSEYLGTENAEDEANILCEYLNGEINNPEESEYFTHYPKEN